MLYSGFFQSCQYCYASESTSKGVEICQIVIYYRASCGKLCSYKSVFWKVDISVGIRMVGGCK